MGWSVNSAPLENEKENAEKEKGLWPDWAGMARSRAVHGRRAREEEASGQLGRDGLRGPVARSRWKGGGAEELAGILAAGVHIGSGHVVMTCP